MGDSLQIAKDKRHRSSSSLTGSALGGTRSERKLERNASIPELDDQFSIADARCDELQEKIDLLKSLKRKKKLKKRSLTKVTEPPRTPEHVPFISVRTQPKKKVSQQAARIRRLELPQNPTRGYLDPATVEQHRMIGQVRGYNHNFKNPTQERHGELHSSSDHRQYSKLKRQRSHADGDSMCSQRSHLPSEGQEVACGRDEIVEEEFANYDAFNQQADFTPDTSGKKSAGTRQVKPANTRRTFVSKDVPQKEGTERAPAQHWHGGPQGEVPAPRRRQPHKIVQQQANQSFEERPVVELFNKSRMIPSASRRQGMAPMSTAPMSPLSTLPVDKKHRKARNTKKFEDEDNEALETMPISIETKHGGLHTPHPRRIKFRSRRYEMPTVASQMKQAGMRNYYNSCNHTNIPFVVSKSTAPSHNIGVNIQQVLNGLKIQQPLSGIPLTIAHHMGLGHVPTYNANHTIVQPSWDHHSEINAIRVGRRLLRLPSYKYISYSRMLNLYREGDGMVPRFLRAIARPNYFYTSMYNLAINREDFDCATSKGRGSYEAKQSLAQYANLYREYENINKCLDEGNREPELERRKEELTKELAAREEHIRKVVQDYRTGGDTEVPLRASMSTAADGYRQSTYKLGECGQ